MKTILFNLALALSVFIPFAAQANHLSGKLLFAARFTGSQEVPPVTTNATGVGTFFLNATMDTLCVNITVNGLSGSITGAHIHTGAAGTNGGVLLDFTGDIQGNSIMATITGAALTPELLEAMLRSMLYFNIHTAANPSGEIRGQILLEEDKAYTAFIDAEQETAEVMSDATGLATFNLNKAGTKVTYRVVVEGLTGPALMAHLHMAAPGMDGAVVVNLTPSIVGNVITGSFDPTAFSGLLAAMNEGNVYINVHTAAFPAGEIRGQLALNHALVHDARIDVAQEIPAPMNASGNGLAIVALNYTMDTLFYHVQVEGLTGAIAGAHFHEGELGATGGVLIDLTGDVEGNTITGFVTDAALSNANIVKFLSGGIYINIHTDMNPSGEIRGQVYKLAREGYVYNLEGAQEVPPVTTSAYGSGMASIDRDQTNVHFMLAYNDLSGPQTMAHFHMGAAGTTGEVIFDLGLYFTQVNNYDAAFGYWSNDDPTDPFMPSDAMAFRNEMAYVNIHSMANMSGELRGQVLRDLTCAQVLGVRERLPVQTIGVFPNPSNGNVFLQVSSLPAGTYPVQVYDITGRKVHESQIRVGGQQTEPLSIQGGTQGVYMVIIRTPEVNYGTRLILQ